MIMDQKKLIFLSPVIKYIDGYSKIALHIIEVFLSR